MWGNLIDYRTDIYGTKRLTHDCIEINLHSLSHLLYFYIFSKRVDKNIAKFQSFLSLDSVIISREPSIHLHSIMAPPTAIHTNGYEDPTPKIVPEPLTVAGVSARRAKAPKISGGIATYAGSEMFNGPVVWLRSRVYEYTGKRGTSADDEMRVDAWETKG